MKHPYALHSPLGSVSFCRAIKVKKNKTLYITDFGKGLIRYNLEEFYINVLIPLSPLNGVLRGLRLSQLKDFFLMHSSLIFLTPLFRKLS